MKSAERFEIKKGVSLNLVEAKQFKTSRISIFFKTPIKRENVTKISLLRQVLKRGCKHFPTVKALSRELEDLYGASLSGGIRKKGDLELFYFTVEYIADRFAGENLTEKVINLLYEVVLNPLTQDGAFSEEYLNQEKNNLKNYIGSIINDKREYAQLRCVSEMFKGEPYGIFEYGYVEDFDGINSKNLYDFYKQIISEAEVEIFVSGTFSADTVKSAIMQKFDFAPREKVLLSGEIAKKPEKEKRITESMEVTQSKLCMGLSCGISPKDPRYFALVVYNCVFGGSPFSKLFNNVRERLSLAYYVFSRIDKMKSFMLISAGIENDKFDAAYGEIMTQMEKMNCGDVTDEEISAAKSALSGSFNSMRDSLAAMEDFYMSNLLFDDAPSLDEIIEKINAVKKEEMIEAGKEIKLDTVYFLCGKEAK